MICHWDEAASGRAEAGHIAGEWTDLGHAAGTKTVGLNRIRIDPGKWSTPFHRETAEEEIFYVLAGSGICLLDGSAFEVRPGDCIVHRVGEAHAVRAGNDGLDVLAFGTRGGTQVGHLPRAGVGWIGGTWTEVGAGDHPYEREAAVGEPELPEVGPRPARVVNVDEVEGTYNGQWKLLAKEAGSELTGLNWGLLHEGEESTPPHAHSADEEINLRLPRGRGRLRALAEPAAGARGLRARGAADPRRPRHLPSGLDGNRPRHPRGRARLDLSGVRNSQFERRLLLHALEQDLLPRPRSDRPARGSGLQRRGTAVAAVKEKRL